VARIGPEELPALWKLRRADLDARGRLVEEDSPNQPPWKRAPARSRSRSALKVTTWRSARGLMRELRTAGRQVVKYWLASLDRVLDDPI